MAQSSERRGCVKVEVTVLSFPSLMVSVDVKQHERRRRRIIGSRAQELCESRGGRPGLKVEVAVLG